MSASQEKPISFTYEDEPFSIVAHGIVRDPRLSYKAVGFLIMCKSLPKDWNYRFSWLASRKNQEGQYALRKVLEELKTAGYLKITRKRSQDGKYHGTNWNFDWKAYRGHEVPFF
jgi:hypothetical protein